MLKNMQFFTWYNGDNDHVEHVVKQQSDADSHQDKLALVLWLLVTTTMIKVITEIITIGMIKMEEGGSTS